MDRLGFRASWFSGILKKEIVDDLDDKQAYGSDSVVRMIK